MKIKLIRLGKKKQVYYKIVAAKNQISKNGEVLEVVGNYRPALNNKTKKIFMSHRRIKYWFKQGANTTIRIKKIIQEII